MLIRLMVVIISQYRYISNLYVVYLELIGVTCQLYLNNIENKLKELEGLISAHDSASLAQQVVDWAKPY